MSELRRFARAIAIAAVGLGASGAAHAVGAPALTTTTLPSDGMFLSMTTDAAGTTRLLQEDGDLSIGPALRLTIVPRSGSPSTEQLIPSTRAWSALDAALLDGDDALIGVRTRHAGSTPSRAFLMQRSAGLISKPVPLSRPSRRGASLPWFSSSASGAAAVLFEETRSNGTARRRVMLRGAGGGAFRSPVTLPRRRFVGTRVVYGAAGDGALVTTHNGIHPLGINRVSRDGTLGRLVAIDDRPVDAVIAAVAVAGDGTIGVAWMTWTRAHTRWDVNVAVIPRGRSAPSATRVLATERELDDSAIDAAWSGGHLLVAVAFGDPEEGATTENVVRVYDANARRPRSPVLSEVPGRDAQAVQLFGRADGSADLVWSRINPADQSVLYAHRAPAGTWPATPTVIAHAVSLFQDLAVPRPDGGLSVFVQPNGDAIGDDQPLPQLVTVIP